MANAQSKIRQFIVHELMFQKDEEIIKFDESLLEKGVIDSAAMMDLVIFLEKEFSISVSRTDILPENFETIDAMADFLKKKKELNPAI